MYDNIYFNDSFGLHKQRKLSNHNLDIQYIAINIILKKR